MVPKMSSFQTNPSLYSEHLCKSVNPHRHGATDTSTRKLSNRTKRAEHGNPSSPQSNQVTRHWPNLAREKNITHWACTEVRMLKEDQLWFSERYTKEDKMHATWEPPMDRREGRRTAGIWRNMCYFQTARFFGLFENPDCHETLRWLLATKRFLLVKIPIGNGSENVTLMVVYAHPGRGKEATAPSGWSSSWFG